MQPEGWALALPAGLRQADVAQPEVCSEAAVPAPAATGLGQVGRCGVTLASSPACRDLLCPCPAATRQLCLRALPTKGQRPGPHAASASSTRARAGRRTLRQVPPASPARRPGRLQPLRAPAATSCCPGAPPHCLAAEAAPGAAAPGRGEEPAGAGRTRWQRFLPSRLAGRSGKSACSARPCCHRAEPLYTPVNHNSRLLSSE